MRVLRNTLTVLALSTAAAIALYGAVELSAGGGPAASSTANAGQTYLCPVTGCSATGCHGATGQPAPNSSASAGVSPGDGSSGSASQVMTCPRTGCTASTCHGANGQPPPSGGSGRGRRRGYANTGQDGTGQSQGSIIWQ
jgi:hypothetical protein